MGGSEKGADGDGDGGTDCLGISKARSKESEWASECEDSRMKRW